MLLPCGRSGLCRALVVVVVAGLLGWSLTPAPWEIDSNGAKVLGARSHVLPLVRFINWVGHPFRKWCFPLSVEDLKAKASKKSGLHEFGDLADWDSFHSWVQEADRKLNFLGRFLFTQKVSDFLGQHLFMAETLRKHPEVMNEHVEHPIIIAPYTRAASTLLYRMIALIWESHLRHTKHFEVLGGPFEINNPPTMMRNAEIGMSLAKYFNPPLSLLHEFTLIDDPEEDSGWFGLTFRGLFNVFLVQAPTVHFDFYNETNPHLWFKLIKTIMQIKQWQESRKMKWILKAPEYLQGLPFLNRYFPGARIITLDRPEVDVYISALLITYHAVKLSAEPDIQELLLFTDILVCKELEAMAVAHNGSFDILRLNFKDVLKESFKSMARVAAYADLPWDNDFQMKAQRVTSAAIARKPSRLSYNIADFGITKADVEKRLKNCAQLPKSNMQWEEMNR